MPIKDIFIKILDLFSGVPDAYKIDNNRREKAAIWNLLDNSISLSALCNDTWKWFAVNIPLNLVDKNQPNGDIDILVHALFFKGGPDLLRSVYRCFEVKTSKISTNDEIKSLKSIKKFKKIKGQLGKLKDFGANQIFLLWAFILEPRYDKALPKKIYIDAMKKLNQIAGSDFGYELFFIERSNTIRFNQNVHPAKELTIKGPFQKIIDELNNFWNNNHGSAFYTAISYCERCQRLTLVNISGPHHCEFCRKKLF